MVRAGVLRGPGLICAFLQDLAHIGDASFQSDVLSYFRNVAGAGRLLSRLRPNKE
jgi:hypothetical protein